MVQGTFVKSKVKEQLVLGADSGTVTVDLPTANYLQGLKIRVQNTNGSTSNTGETIESAITKIELTANGSVIYSATGENARKFEHFDGGNFPPFFESQKASAVQWASFPIKFGRTDFDKDVILPSWKFSSLQLKVTWAFTDSATAGWTTSETNAKMDVIANYLFSQEKAVTPFLRKIEVKSKTVSSTGTEEVDLPVGAGNGAYRRIMMVVHESGIEDGTDVDKYELLVNDSQRIVDERWDTSQIEDMTRYRLKTKKSVVLYKSNGGSYTSGVSRITAINGNVEDCCGILGVGSSTSAETIVLTLVTGLHTTGEPLAVGSAKNVHLQIESEVVPFATMIDLGTDDLADSFDVSKVSTMKIRYNQAAAGSTNTVVAEQLVVY